MNTSSIDRILEMSSSGLAFKTMKSARLPAVSRPTSSSPGAAWRADSLPLQSPVRVSTRPPPSAPDHEALCSRRSDPEHPESAPRTSGTPAATNLATLRCIPGIRGAGSSDLVFGSSPERLLGAGNHVCRHAVQQEWVVQPGRWFEVGSPFGDAEVRHDEDIAAADSADQLARHFLIADEMGKAIDTCIDQVRRIRDVVDMGESPEGYVRGPHRRLRGRARVLASRRCPFRSSIQILTTSTSSAASSRTDPRAASSVLTAVGCVP